VTKRAAKTWTSALRTRPDVTNIAATLWEVLPVAATLVTDLAPIRKLAKISTNVKKTRMDALSFAMTMMEVLPAHATAVTG